MGAEPEIALRGVSKRYPGAPRDVLPRLDLDIARGEFVVLVGPSGCGKSTTLRIIAGLEDATTGTVHIGDRDVTKVAPAERDIAMVFQSYALYPHLSVYENLAFALRLRRLPKAEIDASVRAAARSLELEPLLDRKPAALSGGQRQRVAIGRAVVRRPRVFLFDEPLSNLDAKLRGEMRREIARVHREAGATSVYVTHDQVEAMTLADRIVVMSAGVVQQIGAPTDIYDRPANRFVAGFFGTPTMNFVDAVIDGDGVAAIGDARVALPVGATLGPVTLGIRPEHVRVDAAFAAGALAGTVAAREVLGAEAILHVATASGELRARVEASHPARSGEAVALQLTASAVHVFPREPAA